MTTQTMDTVYLDGSEYWTSAEPLGHLPGLPVFMAFSTANQRGYDATWSIVADKLFLVALAGITAFASAGTGTFNEAMGKLAAAIGAN